VRLVPREGVTPRGATAGTPSAYADRRYADAELVDYSRPGFAVVYLEGEPRPAAPLAVALRGGGGGARFEPEAAAIPVGGGLVVENRSDEPRVVTCPAAGVLQRLAPGESLTFAARAAGELELFASGAPDALARVFAAPGPFAAVSAAGRYEIHDVAPGEHRLHAWHPRLPPAAQRVELAPGRMLRVDLELGVGLPPPGDGAGDAR
jgi:hypothetical protein